MGIGGCSQYSARDCMLFTVAYLMREKLWLILFGDSSIVLEVIPMVLRLLYATEKASTKIGQPILFLQI